VEASSPTGTALHWAASHGADKAIAELLQAGAQVMGVMMIMMMIMMVIMVRRRRRGWG
jgi:hypothetical protein